VIRIASLVSVMILAGSVYTFYRLIVEKKFTNKAQTFIKQIKSEGINLIDLDKEDIDFAGNSITLTIFGTSVSPERQRHWREKLDGLGLSNTRLIIQQSDENSELKQQVKQLQSTYAEQLKLINGRDELLKNKDLMIRELKDELHLLYTEKIPFDEISREAKLNYDALKQLGYARRIHTDFTHQDTLVVFSTMWDKKNSNRKKQYLKMREWLKLRLKLDTLAVEYREQ
jgi:hypothetical protein